MRILMSATLPRDTKWEPGGKNSLQLSQCSLERPSVAAMKESEPTHVCSVAKTDSTRWAEVSMVTSQVKLVLLDNA